MKHRNIMGLVGLALIVLTAVGLAIAEPYERGWGKLDVQVTTTQQRFDGFAANLVTVVNASGSHVFAMTDCSTQQLATAVTAGTAIGIRAGYAANFNCFGRDSISSVCIVTTNSTAQADIFTF